METRVTVLLSSDRSRSEATQGARDFSWAICGFGQVFIVTGAKSFAARDFGLWPTPKHPAARKKQTLVPRITGSLRCAFLPPFPSPLFPIALRFTRI